MKVPFRVALERQRLWNDVFICTVSLRENGVEFAALEVKEPDLNALVACTDRYSGRTSVGCVDCDAEYFAALRKTCGINGFESILMDA